MKGDEHFNAEWLSGVLESSISDDSDSIPMYKFKKMIKCVAEDGDYFRAVTVISGLKLKLEETI